MALTPLLSVAQCSCWLRFMASRRHPTYLDVTSPSTHFPFPTGAVKGIPDIKSLPAATKQLFQQGVRTAYRGFSLRAVQSLFSGVQWGTYGVVRKATAEQRWGKDFWEGQSLMLATRMGITALKSPFEVVKDRMQVDPLLRAAVTGRGGAHSPAATGAAAGVAAAEGAAVAAKAPGPYAVMRELVRLEGVRGLWAGYPATVARDVVVAYIMLYGSDVFSMGITRAADAVRGVGAGTGAGGGFGGYLASTLQEERRGQGKHWLVSVGAGALSGLTSALLTQPLDLAKTVLQTQSASCSRPPCVRRDLPIRVSRCPRCGGS